MNDLSASLIHRKYANWVSAIVEGTASYCAHERVYANDVKATFDAYVNALANAKKWIAEFQGDLKHSARLYMTQYVKPALATHVQHKAGITEFIFKQKIRVFVREVDSVEECTHEHYSLWRFRDLRSKVVEPESAGITAYTVGQIPVTVYKIISADGINWKDTFERLLERLDEIKNANTVHDPAASTEGELISLKYSCDTFDLLKGNENHIEAGVTMAVPYMYEFEKPHLVDVHEVPDVNFL